MLSPMMAACTGAIDYVGPTTYIAFVKLLQWQDAIECIPPCARMRTFFYTVPSLFIKAGDFFSDAYSIQSYANGNSIDSFRKETLLGESCQLINTTKVVMNYNQKPFLLLQLPVYKICQCPYRQDLCNTSMLQFLMQPKAPT